MAMSRSRGPMLPTSAINGPVCPKCQRPMDVKQVNSTT